MHICCVGLLMSLLICLFFFFKQKTAYEMRISDWSSDVCSSDLVVGLEHTYGCGVAIDAPGAAVPIRTLRNISRNPNFGGTAMMVSLGCEKQIGRASCRERVCQYV